MEGDHRFEKFSRASDPGVRYSLIYSGSDCAYFSLQHSLPSLAGLTSAVGSYSYSAYPTSAECYSDLSNAFCETIQYQDTLVNQIHKAAGTQEMHVNVHKPNVEGIHVSLISITRRRRVRRFPSVYQGPLFGVLNPNRCHEQNYSFMGNQSVGEGSTICVTTHDNNDAGLPESCTFQSLYGLSHYKGLTAVQFRPQDPQAIEEKEKARLMFLSIWNDTARGGQGACG